MRFALARFIVVLAVTALTPCLRAAEPALPAGLDGEPNAPADEGPALPAGLQGESPTSLPEEGPALPAGLGGRPVQRPAADEPALPPGIGPATAEPPAGSTPASKTSPLDRMELPFALSGFWEMRAGPYTQAVDHQRPFALAETRLQLELDKAIGGFSFHLTHDFLYDQVAGDRAVNLETGRGWSDLREANVEFSPLSFMDVKLGRQILTWGTGDLLFLNDLFPKDWNAFLIGRDTEYLKSPSDAAKISLFSDWLNVDVVYSPAFDADRFVDGRRVNYDSPMTGTTVGRNAIAAVDRPDRWFHDDEWAGRLYRRLGAWELAGYFYSGYWKSPRGSNPLTGRGTFPRLDTYGASIRGPLGKGIANAEVAFYDSRDDRRGDNPWIPNRQLRALVGYEQELWPDFTVGLQYYLEHMLDNDAYRRTLPTGLPAADRDRHVLTGRLTLLTMMQNLQWSLFVFYSPSDEDAYLRPKIHYKIDDHWSVELGGNVFVGRHEHTFFGQFRDNSDVYLAVRYSF